MQGPKITLHHVNTTLKIFIHPKKRLQHTLTHISCKLTTVKPGLYESQGTAENIRNSEFRTTQTFTFRTF